MPMKSLSIPFFLLAILMGLGLASCEPEKPVTLPDRNIVVTLVNQKSDSINVTLNYEISGYSYYQEFKTLTLLPGQEYTKKSTLSATGTAKFSHKFYITDKLGNTDSVKRIFDLYNGDYHPKIEDRIIVTD